jgi:hypothetical protein
MSYPTLERFTSSNGRTENRVSRESTRTAIVAYKRSWREMVVWPRPDFHKERKKKQKRKKAKEGEAYGKCRS